MSIGFWQVLAYRVAWQEMGWEQEEGSAEAALV